ncbi:P2Y purinoceptor 6 [Halichoerus grypus]
MAFDQQPLVLPPPLYPPHHRLSSAGVGRVPGRRHFLRLFAPLGPSFRQALVLGMVGRGWPPQGLFQSETALPGNRGSHPPHRRCCSLGCGQESGEPHVWPSLALTHLRPPRCFGDRRLPIRRLQPKEGPWFWKVESRLRSLSGCRKHNRAAMEWDNGTGQALGSPPTTCVYRENFKRLLLPPVYSVVLVAGLPLNACVIAQICTSRRALTRTAVYTLNLALADLLYACSLPLLIYNYAQGDHWPFGDLACRLVRFLFYANLHGSILFLTCISFQRYLGICYPLAPWHKRGGRRTAWLVCGAVWLAVTTQCLPTALFAATGIQRNRTVCYDLSPPALATRYLPYGMALTVIGFLLPFIALLACYCRLARRLCRPDGPVGPVARERRGKAARMALVVAAAFAISFLPFHVTKTAYLAVRSTAGVPCPVLEAFAAAYKGTRPFASANSVLDPILFYFTQKKFRQRPQELLQKLTAKWQRQGH